MPSRKVISVLIVSAAVVMAVVIYNREDIDPENTVGLLNGGYDISLTQDTSWHEGLGYIEDAKEPESSNTITNDVSKSLVANYLTVKQGGGLNTASAQNLIGEALRYIQPSNQSEQFTLADIVVSADNSLGAISTYGASLGNTMKSAVETSTNLNEITLFNQMVSGSDLSNAENLIDIGESYRRLAKSLNKLKVPSSYATQHLQYTNSINRVGLAILDMSKIVEDPIIGLQGLGDYQENMGNLVYSLNNIRLKILEDGVVYKQGESGYYLYYGI